MTTEHDAKGNSFYTRTSSLRRTELETAFLRYYDLDESTHAAYVFPSGMSAIVSALNCFARPEDELVLGDELYCDTPKHAQRLLERRLVAGVSRWSDNKPRSSFSVFAETCSNPHSIVFDIAGLLKNNSGLRFLMLDNTWLTGANYNPFREGHKIDYLVESGSKYISGGQCVAGLCIVRKEHADTMYAQIRENGLHVPAWTCELLLRGLASVAGRYEAASAHTLEVVSALRDISFPKNHSPGRWPPCVFTLTVPYSHILPSDKLHEALAALCLQKGVAFETSFGAAHSKLDTFPKRKKRGFVELRIAIGYEGRDLPNVIDLINSLFLNP